MDPKKIKDILKAIIYYNKCSCCGTPILYPYQICNDCVKQGVQLSGMITPATKKKLKKIAKKSSRN